MLYGPAEWWFGLHGWKEDDRRTYRLFATLAGEAVAEVLNGEGKGNDPLSSWLIHLAERSPKKVVLDWGRLNGQPWLPGWRPVRDDDRWWAASLVNLFNLSAAAVGNSVRPKRTGRPSDRNKAKILARVKNMKKAGEKWRVIYATINEEFGTSYEYSRCGSLHKLLNAGG